MHALTGDDLLLFEGFRLDRQARALCRRDAAGEFVPIAVGSRAFDVLDVLVGRTGDLVSRDEFMAAVWPATAVEDGNLNTQIAALRRVLDEGRADGSCIQTIPGRGYRFTVPVTRGEASAAPAPGHSPGNGAGSPITKQPEAENPPAPSRSGNTPPIVPPRERKWLWCGSLGLVAGALCLLAAVVAASNWHLPEPRETRPAPHLSIVVLPFTSVGDDRDDQNLANGLTDDLTTDLSVAPDFLVTSRHTAFIYGNKLVDTKQVGRELRVRYVLDGNVQRSRDRLRVNAHLIDAETDTQLWAQQFDRDADDLFALQHEIASQLANTLVWELVAAEAARPTKHPDALDYILRGRAEVAKGPERERKDEAIRLFARASALDPQSVEASTGLAAVLTTRVKENQSASPAVDLERAEGFVKQALALSPRSLGVHIARGRLLRAQGRCDEAIPELETVLAANPNSGLALFYIGVCNTETGSISKAILPLEQSIRLDPRDPRIAYRYDWLGLAHLGLSHTDQAIFWFERARSDSPGIPVLHAHLASAYALAGDNERAAAALSEARKLAGKNSYSSIAYVNRGPGWGVPNTHALADAPYFAGLRKAGVPEE
jgi:TolB-like protein/DNA-binding winged helix-turn-helix (wHTH) protein/Flp pilus assembly protein TadD